MDVICKTFLEKVSGKVTENRYNHIIKEINGIMESKNNDYLRMSIEAWIDMFELPFTYNDVFEESKENIRLNNIKNKEKPKRQDKNLENEECVRVSFLEGDDFLAEQVYDNELKKNVFCVYKEKPIENITYKDKIKYQDIIYKPIEDEEIEKKVVRLPSNPLEYNNEIDLDEEIKAFIKEWLDVPEEFIQFSVWNIRRSWVYEKFNSLNYLRAMGETGTGKSRFLNTLGLLHYKPISVAGALTPAVLFRLIEKWKGTLLVDEFDIEKSDESNAIIKIINCGYEKYMPVSRCNKEQANKLEFFDTFCPKILVTRKPFNDKATESRCITAILKQTGNKKIKEVLTNEFYEKTLYFRNKLLMYRFRNFNKINPDLGLDIDLGDLEPRVRQVNRSFVSMFAYDKEALERFKLFLQKYQHNLINERAESFEGIIINTLWEYIKYRKDNGMSLDFSISDLIAFGEGSFYKDTKPRSIGKILKTLGFKDLVPKKVDGKTKKCINLFDNEFLDYVFSRYILGYRVTIITKYTHTTTNNKSSEMLKSFKQTENQDCIGIYGNYGNSVTEETIEDNTNTKNVTKKYPFLINQKEYTKCNISGCTNYECNRDSSNRAYCKEHWNEHAKEE